MQAVIYTKYGPADVLTIEETPTPKPAPNEVLVKIIATTVTPVSTAFRAGNPLIARLFTGLLKPKNPILGEELAGEIVAIGEKVSRFAVGDRVFAAGPDGGGTHAQFICLSEDAAITHTPDSLSDEDAAVLINGGLTALPFLRDHGHIKPGDKVLVIGAAGSVGSFAVQLAALYGAEVTAVCGARNQEMVRDLGADITIDYGVEDFTKSSARYDIIFDTVGKSSFKSCRPVLANTGIYLTTVMDAAALFSPLFRCFHGGKRAKMAATGLRKDAAKVKDMDLLKQMVVQGQLTPVIDRIYPLAQIRNAHEYVETGHKRGNLVISVPHLV